jgi:dihydrofolate reductase
MRKLVAAINMTLDGIGDHTSVSPDEEIHYHYADLLENADVILYGRITYQLMQFWQTLSRNPSGEKSMDDFAVVMDRIPKIVFSNTLKSTEWESAQLANQPLEEVVKHLKQQPGRDILVGSRSLIMQLLKLNMIDEFQLCIHPVIAGIGSALFESLQTSITFKLSKTKTFEGGAVLLYYEPNEVRS